MKLQVPQQMAGVTGPCPQCSASIIAPHSVPAQPPANTSVPAPAAGPQQQRQPQPPQGQSQPQPQQRQSQPQQQRPQSQTPAVQPSVSEPTPKKEEVRPSPSISPLSSASANLVEEPMVDKIHRKSDLPSRPRWMRVIFPLAFLLVAAVLMFVVLQAVGVVDLWKPASGEDVGKLPDSSVGAPADTAPLDTTTPVDTTAPADTAPVDTAPVDTAPEVTPDISEPEPQEGGFPDLSPPPPGEVATVPRLEPSVSPSNTVTQSPDAKSPPQAGSLVKKPRFKANEVLDQFLAAKSLEDRLPLMTESKRTKEELMASCLAGPLREVKTNYLSEMVPRVEDDMRQYLYYISFEDGEDVKQRQRIVVQLEERPGVHEPRVHADAFIEHYDDLLEKYAQEPSKKIVTFHCIAEARTADLVKILPEDLKKQMIRLVIKNHPRDGVVFDAFLSKNSPLMKKIGARAELPYVQSRFCTLSFRWNTENEKYPYIELVDIVALGWVK